MRRGGLPPIFCGSRSKAKRICGKMGANVDASSPDHYSVSTSISKGLRIFMGTHFSMQSFRRGYFSLCGADCEDAPEDAMCPVIPIPARGPLTAAGEPEQSLHDLRAVVMTLQPGTRKAIPLSGQQNPELPALVLYIRGSMSESRVRVQHKTQRRNSHGSARARKNLRGVRMSLVPRPYPAERLLQKVRKKAERFPFACKPKTARAAGARRATERVAPERAAATRPSGPAVGCS